MKSRMRFLSGMVAGAFLFTSCPVSATAVDTESAANSVAYEQVFSSFLVSAFEAGESISSLEKIYGEDVVFDFSDLDTSNLSVEWHSDAQSFIDGYLATKSAVLAQSDTVSLNEAKAIAISQVIKSAEWSVGQGRASDVATEAQYMFLSHYIDRNDYWWNDGNIDYLLDGEVQAGEDGMLAKWITDTDRSSYDSYLKTSSIAMAAEKVIDIVRGFSSLKSNGDLVMEAAVDMNRMKNASDALGMVLLEADVPLEGIDIVQDSAWLINNARKQITEDPTLKLSVLFDQYMNDENVFRDYDVDLKGEVIKATLTGVGSFLLAGMTGGGSLVFTALKSAAIDFTVEAFTDFFNYVSWLALRYSYSSRYALRLSDYLFG